MAPVRRFCVSGAPDGGKLGPKWAHVTAGAMLQGSEVRISNEIPYWSTAAGMQPALSQKRGDQGRGSSSSSRNSELGGVYTPQQHLFGRWGVLPYLRSNSILSGLGGCQHPPKLLPLHS